MENLSFRDWSHWFEEGMSIYNHEYPQHSKAWEDFHACKPAVIAVMGWILSAADSVGTGFYVRDVRSVADEIRTAPEMVQHCIEALARVGLLDLCEDHPAGRPCLRVTLSRAGGPEDDERLQRLIASLPWNGGDL